MASRKRNEYLDAGDSQDEEDLAYDSDAAEDSKAARATKRRKLSSTNESDYSSGEEEAQGAEHVEEQKEELEVDEEEVNRSETISANVSKLKTSKYTKLAALPETLKKAKDTSSKTGVVYLSRIPPFMKPQTVKSLLSPFGPIGRLFLTPESPSSHSLRVKSGGNKKRSFTDGWIEFAQKKDAKLVAETLNARIIGGKKGGWYHDDVWNIKYLKGFKWHHLTEQIANENAERASRLRTEISQTTRENKRFIANVERAKMLEGIGRKKREKAEVEVEAEDGVGKLVEEGLKKVKKSEHQPRRQFRQHEMKVKPSKDAVHPEQSEDVKRILSKIF